MTDDKIILSSYQMGKLAIARKLCFVSNMVMREGRPIGYMYRDQPYRDGDSGWVFLNGSESEEYMDNPHNQALYSVAEVARLDPSIIPLLDAPIGSAFERDSESGKFIAA